MGCIAYCTYLVLCFVLCNLAVTLLHVENIKLVVLNLAIVYLIRSTKYTPQERQIHRLHFLSWKISHRAGCSIVTSNFISHRMIPNGLGLGLALWQRPTTLSQISSRSIDCLLSISFFSFQEQKTQCILIWRRTFQSRSPTRQLPERRGQTHHG